MAPFNAPSRYSDGLPWTTGRKTSVSERWENVSIHPSAEIAPDVEIGPFTVIGPNCRVASGNRLNNNVTLYANVELGEGNEIFPGAVIGGLPQDKKYCGEWSRLLVGSGNVIRENVTIHSGTKLGDGCTIIGNRNLIMAGCHIAHDCVLDDDITMANNVLLGGHVKVERFAGFGGLAAVHHFATVGQHVFVGGLTRVSQDAPPYMLVEGNPAKIWSVNKVGLKRRGFSTNTLQLLKDAHRILFRDSRPRTDAIEELLDVHPDVPEIGTLVRFLQSSTAGSNGRARQPHHLEQPPEEWTPYLVR